MNRTVLEMVAVVAQHREHRFLVAQHVAAHVKHGAPQNPTLAGRARPFARGFPQRGLGGLGGGKHDGPRVLRGGAPDERAIGPQAVVDELERAAGLSYGC